MIDYAFRKVYQTVALVGLFAGALLQSSASVAAQVEAGQETPTAFVAILPVGVDPNPPDPAYLKQAKLTWKGEYEADKKGRPVLDEAGKPVPRLYDSKGKHERPRVNIPKTNPVLIENGTLVVDGWIGKARLNYDIQDLHYLYVSVPGIGTYIVSPTAFPGSVEMKDAFTEKALTITTEGHEVQLLTAKPILGKKTTQSAFVKLDDSYIAARRTPELGYGRTLQSPYVWPGADAVEKADDSAPLPANMLPKKATPICISQTKTACPALVSEADATSSGTH